MAFNDIERKNIENALEDFLAKNRPPVHVRPQLDFSYTLSGQSVELNEVRPDWKNPEEIGVWAYAKATYVSTQKVWKVYNVLIHDGTHTPLLLPSRQLISSWPLLRLTNTLVSTASTYNPHFKIRQKFCFVPSLCIQRFCTTCRRSIFKRNKTVAIDIDKLTEPELLDLNSRIVARLRFLQQMRAHASMLQFSLGERISFQPEGHPVLFGTITKYNRKSVSVITESGQNWTVALSFPRKLEPVQETPPESGNAVNLLKKISF